MSANVKRIKTRFTGVYFRYAKKRIGPDGKPDICYDIFYRSETKQKFERVGWKSEGYSILDAVKLRHQRIRKSRHPELAKISDGRIRTAYVGVYQRYSADRIKTNGKPDVCYDIHYKKMGRQVWEKVGWESEGYKVNDAVILRGLRIRADRHPELQRLHQMLPGVASDAADAEFSPAKQPLTKEPAFQSITLDEAWNVYKERWGQNIKNTKIIEYVYRKHLSSRFGQQPITKISLTEMEKLKTDLLKRMAPGSVKNIFKLFSQIYLKCQEFGLVSEEAVPPKVFMTRAMKEDRRRERYLLPEEISKLFDCLPFISCDLYYIAKISLHTGMRLNDVLNLKIYNVDTKTGVIHIHNSKNGERTAYIPEALKYLMEKIIAKRTGYIFVDKSGEKFSTSKVSAIFSKIMQDIGLNNNINSTLYKATFHTLRHTFCSWLAIDGVSIYTISQLAGHKSVEMTMRYAKLSPDSIKSVLNNTFQKTESL